ncbi:MAG TPA: hypothetical protein VMB21_08520 [Candidatus Limnocylindria bacterium]|jgi:hypothetical protein|nr:hypothetical protein [Candidatus Limnocylindria bacterium]
MILLFLLPILIALVLGAVGVMHTGELGGRFAAVLYSVPSLLLSVFVLELQLHVSNWVGSLLAALPLPLVWLTLFQGFRSKQKTWKNAWVGVMIAAALSVVVCALCIWPEPLHLIFGRFLPPMPPA